MNLGELKTRLASISHRSDLAAQLVNFAADATEQINRRLGLALAPLVLDDDTNEILTDWSLLYLYAALTSLYEFTNDGDNGTYYLQRFNEECDRQNITRAGTTPLVMVGA